MTIFILQAFKPWQIIV